VSIDNREEDSVEYDYILYEKSEGLATITINRPEVRNALTQALMGELGHAIDEAESDDEVRVLILTGEGDKSFISGADIGEVGARNRLTELGPNSRSRRGVLSPALSGSQPTRRDSGSRKSTSESFRALAALSALPAWLVKAARWNWSSPEI
jgi:enoyl-CoA hydratase/carnithine racemase